MKFDIILKDLEDKDLEIVQKKGTLNIPSSTTEIAPYACWGLKYLTVLHVPNRVKKIGEGAFDQCVNLETVFLPDSLTELHHNAFSNCPNIKIVCLSANAKKQLGDQLDIFPEEVVKVVNLAEKISTPNANKSADKNK